MNIGDLIHNRRLELKLTLEEVGDAVGVGKSTVKKWEDGYISNMKRDKIASLARILKISPVSLITGDLEEIVVKEFEFSQHEKKVIQAYRNKPEMQPAIDKLLGLEDELVALPMAARSETNKPVGLDYISREKLEQLRNDKSVADEVDL